MAIDSIQTEFKSFATHNQVHDSPLQRFLMQGGWKSVAHIDGGTFEVKHTPFAAISASVGGVCATVRNSRYSLETRSIFKVERMMKLEI